jgi:thiosulfate reductase cytochrome b subunit
MREEGYVYRHGRLVRVTHWVNAFAVLALLLTGFGITQLYAPLHWGDAGQDWGGIGEETNGPGGDAYPTLARAPNVSWKSLRAKVSPGTEGSGPGSWLEEALWSAELYLRTPMRVGDHILFAWLFLFNGLVYLAAGIFSGRFTGLLRPSWRELSWRRIGPDLWNHVRLRFPKGEEAHSYNLIQKYAYLFIIFVALPLQLLTGLVLLPWMDGAFPWFKDLLFGRQSARTLHFGCSVLVLAFVLVHLAMVVISGFRNNMRSMITGWYRLPR